MKNCQHKKPQAKPLFWSQKIDSERQNVAVFTEEWKKHKRRAPNEIRNRISNGNQQLEQNQGNNNNNNRTIQGRYAMEVNLSTPTNK